ncbi:hypothetical protein GE107_25230 [Cohnella sp. CFH 77786]|uniref:hypothetical protein n=1 Tax=Cohnella sp. CFH 77786 TaxID=2662265 RepID=UPI001C609601|nr:hypothetical protein [Cohnella sp. CFH 77786]MBW5449333.1 hypothetical protein [Cohnella sp. CFH 77786]
MLFSWLLAVPLEFLVGVLVLVLILFGAVLVDEFRSKFFSKRYDAMLNRQIERMERKWP